MEIDTPQPAVFLDRDGVLNVDHGYVHRIEDFEWVDGALEAVRRLNRAGYLVFVVTNQSGVARGYYDEADVHVLHGWMTEAAERAEATIDDFRYCPHHVEGSVPAYAKECGCRKPMPGMIMNLMMEWRVDPKRSFLVGDKPGDIEAAKAAGIDGYLFAGGNLDEFVAGILDRRAP